MRLLLDGLTVLSQIRTAAAAVCFILWDLSSKALYNALSINVFVSVWFVTLQLAVYIGKYKRMTNGANNHKIMFCCFCVKFKTYMYWLQNFFKDPWNTFDFITVIGSIIDALVIELGVSKTEVIPT
jgi:hypothetical protein